MREVGDELLEAVVPPPCVIEDVTTETAHVRQKVARGETSGGHAIAEGELREVVADRRIEVKLALVGKLLHKRRRPQLRDRADLEQRIDGGFDAR
jgi:hypothetical protein